MTDKLVRVTLELMEDGDVRLRQHSHLSMIELRDAAGAAPAAMSHYLMGEIHRFWQAAVLLGALDEEA